MKVNTMKVNILYLFLTIGALMGCQGSERKDTYQENTTYPSNLDGKYPAPTYQNTPQSPLSNRITQLILLLQMMHITKAMIMDMNRVKKMGEEV